VTLSEALKSHFIEKMHLLQGAWHRTTKPQKAAVISFGPYVATFVTHPMA